MRLSNCTASGRCALLFSTILQKGAPNQGLPRPSQDLPKAPEVPRVLWGPQSLPILRFHIPNISVYIYIAGIHIYVYVYVYMYAHIHVYKI